MHLSRGTLSHGRCILRYEKVELYSKAGTQKAATVKQVQQQTARLIIFHINCGRFCLQFFSRFSRG